MKRQLFALVTVLAGAFATMLLTEAAALGQDRADHTPPPRTSWGDPDLSGIWDFRTMTPLERPDELEGKAILRGSLRVPCLGASR